jgi:hypothetical protein
MHWTVRGARLIARLILVVAAMLLLALTPRRDWPYWVGVGIVLGEGWLILGGLFAVRWQRLTTWVPIVGFWLFFVLLAIHWLVDPGLIGFAGLAAAGVCRLEWILDLIQRGRRTSREPSEA